MSDNGLSADLRAAAALHPGRPALVSGDDALTFAELDGQADRVAAGLHRIGVRRGDRVVFLVGNLPVFAVLLCGGMRAGAVAVPLSPRLRAPDLRTHLGRLAPRAIVAAGGAAGEVMASGPHAAPVFVVGRHPTARPFAEVLADVPPPEVGTGPDDGALIAYTAGTTGAPKAAVLSRRALAARVDLLPGAPAWVESGEVVAGALPLPQLVALVPILGTCFRRAATLLVEERGDPAALLRRAAELGAAVLAGAPPAVRAWAAAGPVPASLRLVLSAGAPLPQDTAAAFADRFGVAVRDCYATVEAGVVAAAKGDDPTGSVGRPPPGVEVYVNEAGDAEADPGDPGEVRVRSSGLFSGYWGDPEATRVAVARGWLGTGDLAHRDEQGCLFLLDRTRDVIRVRGFAVYPRLVEDALCRHPAVADAAVVGEPEAETGERVRAFVVPRPGSVSDRDELRAHCAAGLARFEVPSRIEVVERLPRLQSGKVLRRMLRTAGSVRRTAGKES